MDRAALAVFVQDFTEATGLGITSEPFCFGDSPQLADELAALVRSGRKRATATTIVEFEHMGEPLPTIGQHSVVYDGVGQPVCVIRTEHLSVGPLDEVWIQRSLGMRVRETARTRIGWRSIRCIGGGCCRTSAPSSPRSGVVLERFSVLWPRRDEADVLAARKDAYVRPVWIEDRDWLADTMRQRVSAIGRRCAW